MDVLSLGMLMALDASFGGITHMYGGLGDGSGVYGTFSGCPFSLDGLTHYWRKTVRND